MAGFSLHRELEIDAEAGIPAPEVLRLATLGAARIFDVRKAVVTVKDGLVYRPAELYRRAGREALSALRTVSFSDRVAEGVVSMFASARLMAMRPVALGMKSHIGWTAVVALAGPAASAEVVAKRRIDMATTFDEGAVYHKGQELPFDRAEALIRSSEEKFERTAREALSTLVAELQAAGCEVVASGLVSGDGKALPPLASILRSHALVHAAEGELYRRVLIRACEACGIRALAIPAKEIELRAAGALGIAPARLAARLAELGKRSGRPWARDQKESALAGWIALGALAGGRT